MNNFTASEEELAKKHLHKLLGVRETIVSVSLRFVKNIDNTPNKLVLGNSYNGYKIISAENEDYCFAVFCEYKNSYRYRFFDKDKFEIISILN